MRENSYISFGIIIGVIVFIVVAVLAGIGQSCIKKQ